MAEFSDYAWLVSDDAVKWLAAADCDHRPALQQLAALRKHLSVERARLVVEQTELRRRAAEKFGALAPRLFFTPTLLEQATDQAIALYKAARFRQAAGSQPVHDVCCGIGGDLVALAATGPAIGYDSAPIACLLAECNLRVVGGGSLPAGSRVVQQAAEQLALPAGEPWALDPDRRVAGRRTTAVEHFSPSIEVVNDWLSVNPDGAVKLAPASDAPAAWCDAAEREWITRNRECRQQIVWFGRLARDGAACRATCLVAEAAQPTRAVSFTGQPDAACDGADSAAGYLFDADPSIHASQLLGALAMHHGLARLGAGGGYLTGEHLVDDPLLAAFAVADCLPLRAASIAAALAARGVGRVEIKKRGVAVEPAQLRRQLKLRGDNEATLLLTRIARQEVAVIARRIPRTTMG